MSARDGSEAAGAALARGRAAYARRAWREAYDALGAADRSTELEAEDLQLLATSAALTRQDG